MPHFVEHAAKTHGGVARPKGESQEFTNEQVEEALKEAFAVASEVMCYRCSLKTFSSRGGLKYHLQICGRTKDELEVGV